MMCLVLSVMVFAQTGVDFRHLTFDEALAKAKAEKKLVFVDCYTTWCGPCKAVAPILDDLAKEYKDQIYIYKIDTDQEQELAADFGIRSIPSLLFIPMNGQPQMIQGAIGKEEFKKIIDEFLLKE